MIYRRALTRELVLSTAAVLAVVTAIAMVTLFIRTLGDVARGKIANEAVFAFLGFALVHVLPVLMTIALFVGVLLPLSRMWRDSEMVIWLNSGLSALGWVRPVLAFALPYVILIFLITSVFDPWTQLKKSEYRQELKSRSDTAMIAPGLFVESNTDDTVYFVGALNPLNGVVKNVFMQSTDNGRLGVTVAREGRQTELPDGSRYLVLDQGRRYEGTPGTLAYRVVEFSRYWMRLDPVDVPPEMLRMREMMLPQLLRETSPEAAGELIWRIGMPLSALILALAAIPLSFVNVRARRSYGLIAALLLYFIYNNLLSLSQAWVSQGKLDPWLGTVLLHGLVALGVAWLFRQRLRAGARR